MRRINLEGQVSSKSAAVRQHYLWCRLKLAELDKMLPSLGKSAESLTADARKQADLAIVRLHMARDALKARIDAISPDADTAKALADRAFGAIVASWVDVEVAFQEFAAAAAEHTDLAAKTLAARAEAQSESWRSFLKAIRASSRAAIGISSAKAAASEIDSAEARAIRISCVVCAYNEADRIRNILGAVYRHPALAEVIVVDDGSTDGTAAILAEFPDIKVIKHSPNRGKTYALSQGIAAASGNYLMLLDADLAGVTAADIQALADPVMRDEAEVSISLRGNSLAPFRWIGLDYVSGERVLPTRLVCEVLEAMKQLPRWGGEEFINDLIIQEGLPIAIIDWPSVFNTPKSTKRGLWQGTVAELEMIRDAVGFLSALGVLRQNLALLMLVATRTASIAPAPGTVDPTA